MATEKGRPKAKVDRHRLEYLRSLRFTWEEIRAIMNVSSKTLQRRAKEWGIHTYSHISDATLDGAIRNGLQQFPSYGEVMMRGYLHSQKVQSTVGTHDVRECAVCTPNDMTG